MHQSFCITTLSEESLKNFPKPEIFNSDQGSKFNNEEEYIGFKFIFFMYNCFEILNPGENKC